MPSIGSAGSERRISSNRSPPRVLRMAHTLPHAPAAPIGSLSTRPRNEPPFHPNSGKPSLFSWVSENPPDRRRRGPVADSSWLGKSIEYRQLGDSRRRASRRQEGSTPNGNPAKGGVAALVAGRDGSRAGAPEAGFRTRSGRPMRAKCSTLHPLDLPISTGCGRPPRSCLRRVPSARGSARAWSGAGRLSSYKSRSRFRSPA